MSTPALGTRPERRAPLTGLGKQQGLQLGELDGYRTLTLSTLTHTQTYSQSQHRGSRMINTWQGCPSSPSDPLLAPTPTPPPRQWPQVCPGRSPAHTGRNSSPNSSSSPPPRWQFPTFSRRSPGLHCALGSRLPTLPRQLFLTCPRKSPRTNQALVPFLLTLPKWWLLRCPRRSQSPC